MLKYSAKLLNAVSQSNIKYQSFNHETDLNHELSDDEQKQWIWKSMELSFSMSQFDNTLFYI